MRKKIISAITVAALIMGTLAGCGGNNAESKEDKGRDKSGKVKLTLWHMEETDSRVQAFQNVIKKYNEIVSALRQSKKHSGQTYRSGLDDLSDTIFSDCADKAHHCIQNLRSIGIPCIAERNWCYRQLIAHHVHCAIYNPKENTFYRFNAEDTTSVPDSAGWNFVEMQNLCRLT